MGWDGHSCSPVWCSKTLTPFVVVVVVMMTYAGYYHELFLRQKVFLCHQIPRLKLKGTGVRKPASPETEPNFYTMPWLPELDATTTTAHGTSRHTKNNGGSPIICMDPSSAPIPSSFGGPKDAPRLDDSPKWVTPQLLPILPPETPSPFEVHPYDAQTTTMTSLEADQVVKYPNNEGGGQGTCTTAASALVPSMDSTPFDDWYQPFHPVVAEQGVSQQSFPVLVHAVVEAQVDPPTAVVSHHPSWSYHHYHQSAMMPTLDEMDTLLPVISAQETLSMKKDDDDDIGLADDCNYAVQPTGTVDDVLQSLLQCYGTAFGASPVHNDEEDCPIVPTFEEMPYGTR
jgi:hypothetical protein